MQHLGMGGGGGGGGGQAKCIMGNVKIANRFTLLKEIEVFCLRGRKICKLASLLQLETVFC